MDGKYLVEFIVKLLTSILLYILFTIPILLIMIVFLIYRITIYIILKLQLGSSFWGLLGGLEAVFCVQAQLNNVICFLLIVKSNDTLENFVKKYKQKLEKTISENPQQFSKFFCTRHKAFGFHYLKKVEVDIEKYFSTFKINTENYTITRDELLLYLNFKMSDPLPYNNTGMWDVLVFEKPIKWFEGNNGEKSYAVFTRIHHSVGDGFALLKCFSKALSDSKLSEMEVSITRKREKWFASLAKFVVFILMAPASILFQRFCIKHDYNSLNCSISASSETHFVTKIEERRECVNIIKNIKRSATNTSFTDVMVTATSRSFSDYFQLKGKDPGLSGLPVAVTISKNTNRESIKVENNYSIAIINIPIIYKQDNYISKKIFMESLELVKGETKRLRDKFYEVKAFDTFFHYVCVVLPEWAFLPIIGRIWFNAMLSCIPGFSSVTILDGDHVEDMVFWLPASERLGVALGIFSYDSRLQIGLTVNKALILKREDAQLLVDGIHKALMEMDSVV